jgi:hypothetical protein
MIYIAFDKNDNDLHLQFYLQHLDNFKAMGIATLALEAAFDLSSHFALFEAQMKKEADLVKGLLSTIDSSLQELRYFPRRIVNKSIQAKLSDDNKMHLLQYYYMVSVVELVRAAKSKGFRIVGVDPYQVKVSDPYSKQGLAIRHLSMAKKIAKLERQLPKGQHLMVLLNVRHGAKVVEVLRGLRKKVRVFASFNVTTRNIPVGLEAQKKTARDNDISVYNLSSLQGRQQFMHSVTECCGKSQTDIKPYWSLLATQQQPFGPYRDYLCSSTTVNEVIKVMDDFPTTGQYTRELARSMQEKIAEMIMRLPAQLMSNALIRHIITRGLPTEIEALGDSPIGPDQEKHQRMSACNV